MNMNKWLGCGKVESLKVHGEGDNMRADIIFVVQDRRPDANGQWVNYPIHVPLYAFGQKARLFKEFVVVGQELIIDGKYSSWDNGDGTRGHGMIVFAVEFGFKPRPSGGEATGGAINSPPAGPPM